MLRQQFPIFEHKVFINSCSKGALAQPVRQAYLQYLADWECLGSPWELCVGKLERVRGQFAALVGATPDEIAVCTSVSAAVSALASALDFSGTRNKVVVDDFSFPAVAQVWHAQEPRGAQVVHVPAAGNTIPLEHYAARIDERTAIVSLSHICYFNGARQDIEAIVELAHRHGALVLLDAYQSLGTLPIDVKALGVDFLVGGALKYLLGSSGLAWLYVAQENLPSLVPASSGWFTLADIFAMDIHHNTPSPTARRFEAGTPPVPNLYAAEAGLDLVLAAGVDRIAERIAILTDDIKLRAQEAGYVLATPAEHGALVCLRSTDAPALVHALEAENIVTSHRAGNLRVSPHAYNEEEDIARLFAALEKCETLLGRIR